MFHERLFLFWPILPNGLGGRSVVAREGAAHGGRGACPPRVHTLDIPGGAGVAAPDQPTDKNGAQSHPPDCLVPRYRHPGLKRRVSSRDTSGRRRLPQGGCLGPGRGSTPSPADLAPPPSAPLRAPVPSRRRRARELRGRDAGGGSDVFPRLDAALGCRAGEGSSGFSQGTFKLFL